MYACVYVCMYVCMYVYIYIYIYMYVYIYIYIYMCKEPHIKAGYERIEEIIRNNLINADKILAFYQPYVFLLDEMQNVEAFTE